MRGARFGTSSMTDRETALEGRMVAVRLGISIGAAADQLAADAQRIGGPVWARFNGWTLTARPGETAVEILARLAR